MCRVSFKSHSHTAFKDVPPSTQFSRMVRHPRSCWMHRHPRTAGSRATQNCKPVPSSTGTPYVKCTWGVMRPCTLVTSCSRSFGRAQTQDYCSLLADLDIDDELFEIVRQLGALDGIRWLLLTYSLSLLCPRRCSFRVDLGSSALHTSAHYRGCRRSLTTASWKFCLLRSRSPRNSMSSRVVTGTCHVILLRPLGAHVRTRRHTLDTPWMAGSLCRIDSVSTSWPSLLSQTNFVVQRFTLVKSGRWHSQGYWCSNRDDENDVLGAGSVGL